ncbi:MAG TPA: heparinase II/III family protein, partial [Solirubrobacteraceae bacterium]
EAARLQLRRLLAAQLGEDGVHREHSPAFHAAALAVLGRILAADLGVDSELAAAREGMEEALAWMITPRGTLATIGDSEPRLRPPAPVAQLVSPHLQHMLTRGRAGAPPEASVRGFPDSGYVAFRRGGADEQGSYLLQICGFHSRVHKHADDLSFVWHDRGEDLLIDPGRYGYSERTAPGSELHEQGFWYADPKRVYVESTEAHNTVQLDGGSYPRKGVRPYGSGLTRWGERGPVLFSEATVRHHRSIVHSRVLMLCPGEWLIVLDAVADSTGAAHDYVQRFHFGPRLSGRSAGTGLALTAPGQPAGIFMLPFVPAEHVGPVRGQEHPMLGWASSAPGALEPVWTDGFAARDTSRHVFATLLAFGEERPEISDESRTNVSGRRARLVWQADDGRHQIDLNREPEDLELRYRRVRED